MSLSDLASLGSFVSGAAVLGSLVVLFFQMRQMTEQVRQSERNQQAVIRQGRTNALIEMSLRMTDPVLNSAISGPLNGESVGSIVQLNQFLNYAGAVLQHFQENFDQHREGLLNEKDFEAFVRSVSFVVMWPGFRVAWRMQKPVFEDDFASFMDSLLTRIRPVKGDPVSAVAKFNLDLQIELTDVR